MIFGFDLLPIHLIIGGIATLLVLVFQILVGTRRIKFKGVKHMIVHRRVAWSMLAIGILHGLAALIYFNSVAVP